MQRELLRLARSILEVYKENRENEDQGNPDFGDNGMREVVVLAGMKNDGIFKDLVEEVTADIERDSVLAAPKVKCLAAILLHLAGEQNKDQVQVVDHIEKPLKYKDKKD